MATTRQLKSGKWQVIIRKKNYPNLTKSFLSKGLASKWAKMTERKLEKGFYEDLTEANKTSLADVLEKYGKEKVPEKKSQDTPLYMIKKISNHSIGKLTLTNLTTFRLIKYRDEIARRICFL